MLKLYENRNTMKRGRDSVWLMLASLWRQRLSKCAINVPSPPPRFKLIAATAISTLSASQHRLHHNKHCNILLYIFSLTLTLANDQFSNFLVLGWVICILNILPVKVFNFLRFRAICGQHLLQKLILKLTPYFETSVHFPSYRSYSFF